MKQGTYNLLGLPVAVTTLELATDKIARHALDSGRGYVCAANVHMCMEAFDHADFLEVVKNAFMVVPDGKPLYWWMKSHGEAEARQVRGPDLFISLCRLAEQRNFPIALYGGSQETVLKLESFLNENFPGLTISLAISPPFRDLTEDEELAMKDRLNSSGARILFVALGCPKQEKWMASHESSLNPVMVGVGAAFDFYAGTIPVAPEWMRNAGLEWLFRLLSEPSRLWKRYLWNNPRFIFYYVKSFFTAKYNRPQTGE